MKQFKKMGSPARTETAMGLDFPSNNGFSDWKLRKKKGNEEEKEKDENPVQSRVRNSASPGSQLPEFAPTQSTLEKMKKLANHSKSRLFKTTCKASHS